MSSTSRERGVINNGWRLFRKTAGDVETVQSLFFFTTNEMCQRGRSGPLTAVNYWTLITFSNISYMCLFYSCEATMVGLPLPCYKGFLAVSGWRVRMVHDPIGAGAAVSPGDFYIQKYIHLH
jgi:hypothetical protein